MLSTTVRLTAKEREVLALLAEGKTSKEIAYALKTQASTVASHRKALCRKLSAHSAAELVHKAMILRLELLSMEQ